MNRETNDYSVEILGHLDREAPDATSDHDEDVEKHENERHYTCRTMDDSERLQGDTKAICEEAKMGPKVERHRVDHG